MAEDYSALDNDELRRRIAEQDTYIAELESAIEPFAYSFQNAAPFERAEWRVPIELLVRLQTLALRIYKDANDGAN